MSDLTTESTIKIVNESKLELFKKWLRHRLTRGAVTVVFTKKDGSERIMLCTTSVELVPKAESSETKKERKVNQDVMPVYDLESKAWKSFRWDSIKNVRVKL